MPSSSSKASFTVTTPWTSICSNRSIRRIFKLVLSLMFSVSWPSELTMLWLVIWPWRWVAAERRASSVALAIAVSIPPSATTAWPDTISFGVGTCSARLNWLMTSPVNTAQMIVLMRCGWFNCFMR